MYSLCVIKETMDWTHSGLISPPAALSLPAEGVYSETGHNKEALSPPSLGLPFFLFYTLIFLSFSTFSTTPLHQL